MKNILNFISYLNEHINIEQAKKLAYKTELPINNPIFINAVENTEGAFLTDDGLVINVTRYQHENQDGNTSLRTGVFYLPTNDKNIKYYKGGKNGYGGNIKYQGDILIKYPLFSKGATGGKAIEFAYNLLKGKNAYMNMRSDVLNIINYRKVLPENVADVLTKYNETDYDDNYNLAYIIIQNSKHSNTLPYAIQENIVAHAVRDNGYDSVLGYSKKRDGNYFISEIFDVREITYPSSNYESDIHSKFLE